MGWFLANDLFFFQFSHFLLAHSQQFAETSSLCSPNSGAGLLIAQGESLIRQGFLHGLCLSIGLPQCRRGQNYMN
jgi:hypothetical protein